MRAAMVHVDHLYRFAYHLAGATDSVEDLVQDTFVRAIESYRRFAPPSNMRAWLTRILQNLFFDQWRRRKKWGDRENGRQEANGLWNPDQRSPERELLHKELSNHVHRSLKRIPEEFRLPIVLVDMNEFTYAEAADILSCPVGTIRSRLSRGRQMLQAMLREYVESGHGTENDDLRASARTHHRLR